MLSTECRLGSVFIFSCLCIWYRVVYYDYYTSVGGSLCIPSCAVSCLARFYVLFGFSEMLFSHKQRPK